jgi:hypothetical protein
MPPSLRPLCRAVYAVLALTLAGCKDGSGPEEPTPTITHLNPSRLLGRRTALI